MGDEVGHGRLILLGVGFLLLCYYNDTGIQPFGSITDTMPNGCGGVWAVLLDKIHLGKGNSWR